MELQSIPSLDSPDTIATSSSLPSKLNRDDENIDEIESVKPENRFMSPIFHIYVGTEKQHFTGHEAFLARSPKLKFLCAQDAKKGNVKGIRKFFFPMEHPESFGHLLEYLYLNIIAIPTSDSSAETRQLAGLFSVARRFQLHELQEDIIARFYHSQMSSRVSAMEFFSLAKDLFSEGMINSLEKYFAKEAPLLIKTLDDECFPELECMVAEGGPFAQALFAAYRAAFRPQTLGTGPKTPKELKEELSTSSNADGREYIKTEMQAETEYEHETEDEHETKRLKVSPPPWDDLNEADKFLVQLRAETGNWNQISKAWNKANGANASVKTLLDRYSHITAKWWSLNDGDMERLIAAEAQVVAKFRGKMWAMITNVMVEKGADRYPPSFLQKTFDTFMEAEKI